VSSRRNASLVVALGVASLAATSLAAMVATSELLVESFDYPVSGPVDPPVPNLGRPGVLQVEPPRQGRAKSPPGRSREPATEPAPPPRKAGRRHGGGAPADDGRAGVVMAVQRRPARQEPVASRPPAVDRQPPRPAPRPVLPPRPRPAHPEPAWPHRPRRRWTDHKPHPARRVPARPVARPVLPRPADPDGELGGGSPCPDRARRVEEQDQPGRDRHRRDHDTPWRDRDRPRWDEDRRHRDKDERRRDGDGHRRDEGEPRIGEPRRPDAARDRHHDGRSPAGSGDGSQPPSHRQKGWPTGSK
jgi:hypothetical protein